MPEISVNGIQICYQVDGPAGLAPVLLLHGLGCQLVQWPDAFVDGIVSAGYQVLRMDNRDVGLSEKLDRLGMVDIMAYIVPPAAGVPRPPYTLGDMADDAAALLEALGYASAHVVGVSMGGMIAQQLCIKHRRKVSSLTSIMSTSGAPGLPQPDAAAIRSVLTPPLSSSRADIIAQAEASWNLIGGEFYRSTEVGMGRKAGAACDRNRHPPGKMRQMAAVITDIGRADALHRLEVPALVIHGEVDPLVPVGCGEDTARRIPGASLRVLPRMGHDLPDPVIPEILDMLTAHWRAADGRST
jgi:pimeloyl-ACP methyl ester carboxylesterase